MNDQNVYHLPTIRQFQEQLPAPNFSDYKTATTPAYHLALALFARYVRDDVPALRAAGATFTFGLLATFAYALGRRLGVSSAVALAFPLGCSLYTLASGAWLLPDNAAWWGVVAVLLVAFFHRPGPAMYVAGGAALLLCVLTRQAHLWAAAPLWVAALLTQGGEDNIGVSGPNALRSHLGPALRRAATMVAATLPAFAAIAYFVWLWKGTMPPASRTALSGGNAAAPAAVLALVGGTAPFALGYLWPTLRSIVRARGWLIALGAAVGFLVSAIPHTNMDMTAGRWSGIWNVAGKLPTVAGRSPLIISLATIGGAAIAAWAVVLPFRARWVFVVAWVGFMAAQSLNAMAYHRYYEPMVLIMMGLGVAALAPGDFARRWRIAPAGPVALALLLAAITFKSLR